MSSLENLAEIPRALVGCSFVANSRFTASVYRHRFGIEATVIPPTLDPVRYMTSTTREFVTFVNPVPEKGLKKALLIAERCPDIPFLFQESWLLSPTALANLETALKPLTNVRFARRSADMKSVYARTRIVLAPSHWNEAWGRVASEAQCSGITGRRFAKWWLA